MNRDSRFSWTHPLDAWLRRRDARLCPPWQLPRVELEVTRGRTRQALRPLESRAYLIGAANDCDLVLTDPQFPAVYAYVMRDANGVKIRAIAESPMLTVNNRLVEETRLVDGDLVRTGPYEFRVHVSPAPLEAIVERTGMRHRIDPAATMNGGTRNAMFAAPRNQ